MRRYCQIGKQYIAITIFDAKNPKELVTLLLTY